MIRWLDPQIAALHLSTTVSNVYRLASDHGWLKRTIDGKVQYDLDDVEATRQARLLAKHQKAP